MRFDSYHPVINLIYFMTVIFCTIMFRHPVFLALSFLSAFIYSVKLNRRKGLIFDLILLLFIPVYSAIYSYYNHFGVTPLRQNVIGNNVTLEAVVYGAVIAVVIVTVVMWMSCVHTIVSTDKIIYLFGRISPKLSLFFSIILRTVPRVKKEIQRVDLAQKCIGRSCSQGNILMRIHNFVREFSIVLTWMIENFIGVSDSMKNRGYTLKGRTAFSIYRFDNRDRLFVIVLFSLIFIMMMAFMFDQVNILYDPQIVMNRITAKSYIFYASYLVLCLLPMGLQVAGEIRFGMLKKAVG